jgi:hypothetical protein
LWQDAAPDAAVDAAYLIVEFSNANCRSPYVTATVRYDAPVVLHDYSRVIHVRVDPGGAATTVFIPAYRRRDATALAGLELANDDVGCVAQVSRVAARDVPDLLLELNLAPNWRTATLHQTLRALETGNDGAGPRMSYVAAPPGAQWPSLARLQAMQADAIGFPSGSEGIRPVDGGWHVATRPGAPYVYLLRFPDEVVPAASALVVEGELRRGAITIGLLKDERWAGLLNVVDAGGFVALLEQPEPGQYSLVVANWAPPRWLEQYWPWLDVRLPWFLRRPNPVDVVIRRAGWVRGE